MLDAIVAPIGVTVDSILSHMGLHPNKSVQQVFIISIYPIDVSKTGNTTSALEITNETSIVNAIAMMKRGWSDIANFYAVLVDVRMASDKLATLLTHMAMAMINRLSIPIALVCFDQQSLLDMLMPSGRARVKRVVVEKVDVTVVMRSKDTSEGYNSYSDDWTKNAFTPLPNQSIFDPSITRHKIVLNDRVFVVTKEVDGRFTLLKLSQFIYSLSASLRDDRVKGVRQVNSRRYAFISKSKSIDQHYDALDTPSTVVDLLLDSLRETVDDEVLEEYLGQAVGVTSLIREYNTKHIEPIEVTDGDCSSSYFFQLISGETGKVYKEMYGVLAALDMIFMHDGCIPYSDTTADYLTIFYACAMDVFKGRQLGSSSMSVYEQLSPIPSPYVSIRHRINKTANRSYTDTLLYNTLLQLKEYIISLGIHAVYALDQFNDMLRKSFHSQIHSEDYIEYVEELGPSFSPPLRLTVDRLLRIVPRNDGEEKLLIDMKPPVFKLMPSLLTKEVTKRYQQQGEDTLDIVALSYKPISDGKVIIGSFYIV